jgi:cell cycle arrest protein BUB3
MEVELQLAGARDAGISNVAFSPTAHDLLVSTWDGALTLYDADENVVRRRCDAHQAPVLDCCFTDDGRAVSASADRSVKLWDLAAGSAVTLGLHNQPVKCVEHAAARGAVVSAGWDCALHLWDARQPGAAAASAQLPEKAYSLGLTDDRIVVGMAGRHVHVYDMRTMGTTVELAPEQVRQSSLKYQTRCIRCFPNGRGYALSSVEGRVAIEYFDDAPEVQAQKYAFKCHRKRDGDTDTVFPINAMAFNKTHGTFATGGCDGTVIMWDGSHKKKLTTYPEKATSVAALAFSHDDTLLASAVSYTHEAGEQADAPPDQIFIRAPSDEDVRPRSVAPQLG